MKITLATFLSLDGVMQAPGTPTEDTSGGFEHGGWQFPYADEELETYTDRWFAEADAFLLGRRTYEIFAAYWPTVTDPDNVVASSLNTLPKYVVSTTLGRAEWHNTTIIGSDVLKEVAELRARPGRELQIHGSGTLARTLLDHGMIDELRLWTYPVVLGSGMRLFEPGRTPTAMRLVETRPTGSGCVLSVYRPAGRPTYGDFSKEG
ncbi:Dihydrofolate reductase [[Actinomadura] parvosata subsp. kistnae]|uniref:Deaminase n=1 Tax=[Actinomadura] parvosata subsp. kistnae TaxID=1909395 RepID=A0A1V0AFT6_9ACTN|nr:dihydrofolate reductase family protein [Nonomuraea sp. ATCC 55076]AQZ69078.1 deaminase [Nonomuraea sp. ATCC 55076]SPL92342.1 Dihydrofolate reductase [Actinomadura parvosata subsp. kistnae]